MASTISSSPKVMAGKPVVSGTRVTVEGIREKLAAGETEQQILEAHTVGESKSVGALLGNVAASEIDFDSPRVGISTLRVPMLEAP